jgi:hypothetical protein
MASQNCTLDDRVTPQDYAVVAEALSRLGSLTEPMRVLGALSQCGVGVPDGVPALRLLCLAEGVATGIDGAWPMTFNDFLRIYAAVRRKVTVDPANLCQTPEDGRWLMDAAASGMPADELRAMHAAYSASTPGLTRSDSRASSRRNSARRRASMRITTPSGVGETVNKSTMGNNKAMSGNASPALSVRKKSGAQLSQQMQRTASPVVTTAVEDTNPLDPGAPSSRSSAMPGTAAVANGTAGGALHSSASSHHPSASRQRPAAGVKSLRNDLQAKMEGEKLELFAAMRVAIQEARDIAKQMAMLMQTSQSGDLPLGDAARLSISADAVRPPLILAPHALPTFVSGGNFSASVKEVREVCEKFNLNTAVFEGFVREKIKYDKLMSFAKKSNTPSVRLKRGRSGYGSGVSAAQLSVVPATDSDGTSEDEVGKNHNQSTSDPLLPMVAKTGRTPSEATLSSQSPQEGRFGDHQMTSGVYGPLESSFENTTPRGTFRLRKQASMFGGGKTTSGRSVIHNPKFENMSLNVMEVAGWLTQPSALDNANTPRTSVRARARWRKVLDMLRVRNKKARSSWSDMSANVRQLIAAKRAATAGGAVATTTFRLTADSATLQSQLDDKVKRLNERTIAKRVPLKIHKAVENAEAMVASMGHGTFDEDLMLRQLCTPCYGPSRACDMARRLRQWRKGPRYRTEDDLTPTTSPSHSPVNHDFPKSPSEYTITTTTGNNTSSRVDQSHKSPQPQSPQQQQLVTPVSVPSADNAGGVDGLDIDSGRQSPADAPCSTNGGTTPPAKLRDARRPTMSPGGPVQPPIADEEPRPEDVLLAKWTRTNLETPTFDKRFYHNAGNLRPMSAGSRAATPNLGPSGGPTIQRTMTLLRLWSRTGDLTPTSKPGRKPSAETPPPATVSKYMASTYVAKPQRTPLKDRVTLAAARIRQSPPRQK